MPVAAQVPSQSIVAAAAQTVFPFNFRCDDPATLTAWVGNVQQGGFAIFLNADQIAAPGGTVTLPAQAVGNIVTIERVTPQAQNFALTGYGPFPAASIAAAMDKLMELLQEFWAKLTRSILVSHNDISSVSSFTLPTPILGAFIGWVDGGGGLLRLGNLVGFVFGEQLVDSGDHVHFTSAFIPVGEGALYRNGQRVFSPDDYSTAGNVWTMLVALGAGEKLNADYTH